MSNTLSIKSGAKAVFFLFLLCIPAELISGIQRDGEEEAPAQLTVRSGTASAINNLGDLDIMPYWRDNSDPQGANREIVIVKVPVANVRQGPSMKSPITSKVKLGQQLELIGIGGGWCEILVPIDGEFVNGYIHQSLIDIKKVPSPEPKIATETQELGLRVTQLEKDQEWKEPEQQQQESSKAHEYNREVKAKEFRRFVFKFGGGLDIDLNDEGALSPGLCVAMDIGLSERFKLSPILEVYLTSGRSNIETFAVAPFLMARYSIFMRDGLALFATAGLGGMQELAHSSGKLEAGDGAIGVRIGGGIEYKRIEIASAINLMAREHESGSSLNLFLLFRF